MKYTIGAFILVISIFLIGSFALQSRELQTSRTADRPLDHLLERYHTGEISSRRRELVSPPIPIVEEPEIVRLKSQIIDLRVENDQLREENAALKAVQRPGWPYIAHLIQTKRDLLLTKQSLREDNYEAHTLIDELIDHASDELRRLGFDPTSLNELLLRKDLPLSVVTAIDELNRCVNENISE